MFQPIRALQIWKDDFFVEQAEDTELRYKVSELVYIGVRRTQCFIIFTKIISCTININSPNIGINTRMYHEIFIAVHRHTGKKYEF